MENSRFFSPNSMTWWYIYLFLTSLAVWKQNSVLWVWNHHSQMFTQFSNRKIKVKWYDNSNINKYCLWYMPLKEFPYWLVLFILVWNTLWLIYFFLFTVRYWKNISKKQEFQFIANQIWTCKPTTRTHHFSCISLLGRMDQIMHK